MSAAEPGRALPGASDASGRRTRPSLPRQFRNLLSLKDFEAAARRRLPRVLFGYTASGVEDEIGMRQAADAYDRYALIPRFLVGVAEVSTGRTLFGREWRQPFGISPMGICAANAYRGDIVLAEAARAAGIPMVLSGSSLTRMEAVAEANPDIWFQIYMPPDQAATDALIDRVEHAGIGTLVVTIDVPVGANRETNLRNGYSTPLRPSLRLLLDGLAHPRWLFGTCLRTLHSQGMPHFENVTAGRGEPLLSRTAERQFSGRAHLNWSHVAHIRRRWKGSMILKGILHPGDAALAAGAGIDGIVVSSHGGRQLDAAIAPIEALPAIRDAAGGMTVLIDGGIRRGTQVIKALALGADAVFLGRPFNYAATVGGRAGVEYAIGLLADEVRRTMGQIGVTQLADLGREIIHVRNSGG
ncbi:alpha-hydroxy acid oxidase [Mangrovicella endophytica]|uniref:alpha-hydroxy acid oxidase n=1 Tax=Mangrovicella endophytica TaxID=2066697 RepID=UPI000C9E9D18|nr:alpha-hydroxy acid oxidase [Mangrovicella endophytica]